MMPGIGARNKERKKRALLAGFIGGGAVMAYVVVSAFRFGAWEWVPLAVGLAVITVIAVAGLAGRPGGRGRGSRNGRWRPDRRLEGRHNQRLSRKARS
jgi:peptidoglycan/LPS O-acetylase OafA/YrhL